VLSLQDGIQVLTYHLSSIYCACNRWVNKQLPALQVASSTTGCCCMCAIQHHTTSYAAMQAYIHTHTHPHFGRLPSLARLTVNRLLAPHTELSHHFVPCMPAGPCLTLHLHATLTRLRMLAASCAAVSPGR
jgi:hypothetical protein